MKRLLIPVLVLAIAMCSCGDRKGAPKPERPYAKQDVEVSPDHFIALGRRDYTIGNYPESPGGLVSSFLDALQGSYDTTDLRIPWQGTNLVWKSSFILFCLREHAGRLFIIALDRKTDFKKTRFRYYCQKGTAFEEIAAKDFPKAIASQNLWFGTRYSLGVQENLVDQVQLARDLDPSNIYFNSTLTAFVWYQLATGTEYYAMPGARDSGQPYAIGRALLADFVRTNRPVKLTRVIRDPPDAHLCLLRVENRTGSRIRRAFFDAKGAPTAFLIVPNVTGGNGRFAWVRFVKDFAICWDEDGTTRATVLDLSPYAAKTNQIAAVWFTYAGQGVWQVRAQSARGREGPIVQP